MPNRLRRQDRVSREAPHRGTGQGRASGGVAGIGDNSRGPNGLPPARESSSG